MSAVAPFHHSSGDTFLWGKNSHCFFDGGFERILPILKGERGLTEFRKEISMVDVILSHLGNWNPEGWLYLLKDATWDNTSMFLAPSTTYNFGSLGILTSGLKMLHFILFMCYCKDTQKLCDWVFQLLQLFPHQENWE